MTQQTSLVKLRINQKEGVMQYQILGILSNGADRVWGNCRTLRGAKNMITRHAKRFDLIKAADGMSATKQPGSGRADNRSTR